MTQLEHLPESPTEFRTVEPKDLAVTRFNRMALFLVVSVAGAALVSAVWVLGSHDQAAQGRADAVAPIADPEPWYEKLDTAMPMLERNVPDVAEAPMGTGAEGLTFDETKPFIIYDVGEPVDAMRNLKVLEKAISSVPVIPNGSGVRVSKATRGSTGESRSLGTPERDRYLQAVQNLMAAPEGSAPGLTTIAGLGSVDENRQGEKRGFLADAANDRAETRLSHTRVLAESPYMLSEGTVLPCVLEGGINSDLPGAIRARVSENVYDSATGRFLLIPQGTLLSGEYQSTVTFGQSRVLVAGKRLIFPDASSLRLSGMPLVDLQGFSGFEDQVDRHFWRTFGSAVLMAAISSGMQISQGSFDNGSSGSDGESPREILAAALAQQLGQVSSEVIRKNLGVQPTIRIRPGYRFNVMVMQDIVLPGPYAPTYLPGN